MRYWPFAVAGIILLILKLPLLAVAISQYLLSGFAELFPLIGMADAAFTAVTFIVSLLFTLGFALLGFEKRNFLLVGSSIAGVLVASLDFLVQLARASSTVMIVLFTVLYAVLNILVGVAFLNLRIRGARSAGILSVLIGISLVSFVLAPLALFLSFPLLIVEISILFRA